MRSAVRTTPRRQPENARERDGMVQYREYIYSHFPIAIIHHHHRLPMPYSRTGIHKCAEDGREEMANIEYLGSGVNYDTYPNDDPLN
jgi:hypothetical protein